ncbi:MAG TPA: TetR/AcrR family transcriptional regulator [Kofleriaceae bacterium]|nr:TetR/AcrR family transcriptional regulator [Kofleriaceae bacterium]
MAAATRVLTKVGYDDATTNRIAEAAGVSVGSLYQYFPNKEAIVGALIERHDDEMWAVFTHHVAQGADRPLHELAPLVIDALFSAHLVDPALHRVLHEQVPRVGKLARLRETNARARALVARILEARAADLAVDDVATTSFVIVEAIEAIIHQSIETDVDPIAVRREATRLLLRYLGAAPGR